MGWNVIRKATKSDEQALQAAAERFCKRHILEFDDKNFPALTSVQFEIDGERNGFDYPDAVYLRSLWRAIVRRTLGHNSAEGIAYGYVGYSHD